ncbi:unnamed protein product, partial [Notodromas monacha]
MKPVVVLDNGAHTLKVGLSTDAHPKVIPNCIMKVKNERRRAFVGAQIDACKDLSGLFYILAFEKGYLVNWEVQKTIWESVFTQDLELEGKEILITTPMFNFTSVNEGIQEMMFEEFQVSALTLRPGPDLSAWKSHLDCCVIIDCGFSFSHIIPYFMGERIENCVRRVDVGGKVLTNYLTEIVSYRQLNVMDEGYVINQMKEDVSFVSLDFTKDMKACATKNNKIAREYVLPDFLNIKRGFMRECGIASENSNEQVVHLMNERFSVPELLFSPGNVGLDQMGVAEATVEVIQKLCPENLRFSLFSNIILTGGCVKFRNFAKRLERDIRSMACDLYDVKVTMTDDPITAHWSGGAAFVKSKEYAARKMTREDYEELGPSRIVQLASGSISPKNMRSDEDDLDDGEDFDGVDLVEEDDNEEMEDDGEGDEGLEEDDEEVDAEDVQGEDDDDEDEDQGGDDEEDDIDFD